MTDIKYGGMMCPHGHVKAACAICATPPKSPPMTDPKPATPATDDCICEDVRVLGACPVHEPRSTEPANDNLVAAWLADLQGMDDADREHDVTVLDTRSLLYRIAADAEIIKARESAYDHAQEGLKSARKQEAEMRETIKAQAEEIAGMRDALIRLRDCNWVISPPDRMDAVRDIAREALAATEPKG